MSDLRELYQQVILDHNKSPRNFKKLESANRTAEGYNPLCGDHYTLFVEMDGEVIRDLGFQGSGCAISKASASIMSSTLKGKTKGEAESLFDQFHRMVMGEIDSAEAEKMGRLAAFSGIRDFPTRIKCASLAWHTMNSILEGSESVVTTE